MIASSEPRLKDIIEAIGYIRSDMEHTSLEVPRGRPSEALAGRARSGNHLGGQPPSAGRYEGGTRNSLAESRGDRQCASPRIHTRCQPMLCGVWCRTIWRRLTRRAARDWRRCRPIRAGAAVGGSWRPFCRVVRQVAHATRALAGRTAARPIHPAERRRPALPCAWQSAAAIRRRFRPPSLCHIMPGVVSVAPRSPLARSIAGANQGRGPSRRPVNEQPHAGSQPCVRFGPDSA